MAAWAAVAAPAPREDPPDDETREGFAPAFFRRLSASLASAWRRSDSHESDIESSSSPRTSSTSPTSAYSRPSMPEFVVAAVI